MKTFLALKNVKLWPEIEICSDIKHLFLHNKFSKVKVFKCSCKVNIICMLKMEKQTTICFDNAYHIAKHFALSFFLHYHIETLIKNH